MCVYLQAVEAGKRESEGLRAALEQEREIRRECEVTAVQRETELALALNRLGEFERVSVCVSAPFVPEMHKNAHTHTHTHTHTLAHIHVHITHTRINTHTQGEYGLHEAILEIKTKKDEIAVRDRDIAELTQQVNQFDRQVNRLSEFNEMLCERMGVGEAELGAEFAQWRAKREGERGRLQRINQSLQNEVWCMHSFGPLLAFSVSTGFFGQRFGQFWSFFNVWSVLVSLVFWSSLVVFGLLDSVWYFLVSFGIWYFGQVWYLWPFACLAFLVNVWFNFGLLHIFGQCLVLFGQFWPVVFRLVW